MYCTWKAKVKLTDLQNARERKKGGVYLQPTYPVYLYSSDVRINEGAHYHIKWVCTFALWKCTHLFFLLDMYVYIQVHRDLCTKFFLLFNYSVKSSNEIAYTTRRDSKFSSKSYIFLFIIKSNPHTLPKNTDVFQYYFIFKLNLRFLIICNITKSS